MVSRVYLKSAATLLLLTAVGKVIAALGGSEFLTRPAPLAEFLSNRSLLALGAGLEILTAAYVLWRPAQEPAFKAVLGLAAAFVAYRLALWSIGFEGHCNCLGWFGDALQLGKQRADRIAGGVLLYLLAGSYFFLLRLRIRTVRLYGVCKQA
jgi:hypothetical protein